MRVSSSQRADRIGNADARLTWCARHHSHPPGPSHAAVTGPRFSCAIPPSGPKSSLPRPRRLRASSFRRRLGLWGASEPPSGFIPCAALADAHRALDVADADSIVEAEVCDDGFVVGDSLR